MGAEDLVNNNNHVAIIENHNGDPYAYTASDARNTYYGITGYPTAIFDGIKQLVGGNHTTSLYTSYLPMYQARYDIKTNFGVTISGNHNGDTYNISLLVNRYGETPFSTSNLVVHLALTQSNIIVSWQGQNHISYVSRMMSPSATGTPINLSSLTQVTVPLTFTFNTAWGGSIANHDYELVAWVQDLTTKEIVDAQKIDLATIPVVGINTINSNVAVLSIYPNPASENTTVNFYNNNAANTKVEIYNVSGQVVKTLVDGDLNSGSHIVVWDLTNNSGSFVANGIYMCKIVSGDNSTTSKIFVER